MTRGAQGGLAGLARVMCLAAMLVAGGCKNDKADSADDAASDTATTATSSSDTSDPPKPVDPVTQNGGKDTAATAAPDVKLDQIAPDEFADRVAAFKGQVVLVDFWATWCGPCVEQFPHTLAMAKQHGPHGLAVLTFSCDAPDHKDRVLTFLRKQNSQVPNLLTSLDLNETFEAVDIRGGIPYYKLYDRQGQLRYEFNGAPREEDRTEPVEKLEERVLELLAEEPTP